MECRIAGCPGHYEELAITHLEYHNCEPVVIANVPANVCDICGDTFFALETIKRLERLHQHLPHPTRLVPLYTLNDNDAVVDEGIDAISAAVAR